MKVPPPEDAAEGAEATWKTEADMRSSDKSSEILARIAKEGFTIVAQKMVHLTKAQAEAFYAEHAGRPFFEALTAFMLSDKGGQAPVQGRVDASFGLHMSGADLGTALQHSQMALAVALKNGTIDRALVEAASTDLHALFRRPGSRMALECFFGVLTLKNGTGAIGPVRLRAAEGHFAAAGSFDPRRRSVDILVLSDPAASGALALDMPLRIEGVLGSATAAPTPGAGFGPVAEPPIATGFAVGNPCR